MVILADRYSNGIGVPQDPGRSVTMLTTAADAGNAAAARSLIGLYRSGRGAAFAKNLDQSEVLFERYAPLMSEPDRAFEQILLAGTRASDGNSYRAFVELVDAAPAGLLSRLVTSIRSANPNAYSYLVQDRLAKRGTYAGPLNGLMTSATIRAINALCHETGVEQPCTKGPLHWETARVLATLLN